MIKNVTNTHKGWFERQQTIVTKQGIKNKAPVHHKVAVRRGLETTLRMHMVKSNERKPYGYWTPENTLKELKEVIAELGHFPTFVELRTMDRTDLNSAITRNGGGDKFRTLFGYELLQKPGGYWTHENTLKELKEVIAELGHFPLVKELIEMDRTDLATAIKKNGGVGKFRTLFGYELLQKPDGYWTYENTLKELKEVIAELGHFPTYVKLIEIDRFDLKDAIAKNGGGDKFRIMLGYKFFHKPDGYWTHENTMKELKEVIAELGHFPTKNEFSDMDREGLATVIKKTGGVDKFRKLLGYPPSFEESIRMGSYVTQRGYKSEKEVKKLLIRYCKLNGLPEPTYNKKLAIGNVIEFVCGGTIGIDVTNTKSRDGSIIRRKYFEKDYHKHLDKLWIVVLSDVFTIEDYIRFNEESPNNVEIMSVWDLIDTLQVDIDEYSRRKLGALETCTIRTKNELINNLKNRTLVEYT